MRSNETASAARALVRIKELCCLGLSSQTIMPALLKELHGLVPSHANAFIWGDPRQEVENYLSENLGEAKPWSAIYESEFQRRCEREVIWGSAETLRARRCVLAHEEVLAVDRRANCRHGYYNSVTLSAGYDHTLRAIIDDGGRALGAVLMHRAANDPCFTAQDSIHLASITRYLAHALTTPPPELEVPLVDGEEEGLLTLDVTGTVQHLSPEARRLLYLVAHPVISQKALADSTSETMLPQCVAQVCDWLVNVFAGQAEKTPPPVWCYRNAWGGFVFRACRLDNHGPESAPVIGITVRRQEPLPLKVLRQVDRLSLSRRQMQVCLLLAAGHSRPAIAKRLEVSQHTAITYTRQVYNKLRVHNRSELLIKLMAM
jgi:DNA-binding CsgD family transcriptional regulator